jgi:hypothetical protein
MLAYRDYLKLLSEKFLNKLADIAGIYGFEYGVEFEIAICDILRSFLPSKYGVCRGFVVSETGEFAGDDIIIYDQERFPTLKLTDRNDFARKEHIPIEAVYAYIEAKHTLIMGDPDSGQSLQKALEQIRSVKKLCMSRPTVGLFQVDPYLPPLDGDIMLNGMPDIRNPVYTAIVSRFVAEKNSSKITDPVYIEKLLHAEDINASIYNPDLIIAGESNYMGTGQYYDDTRADGKETLFSLPTNLTFYGVHRTENLSYGLLLAYLMYAVDFIRLGRMPWSKMINEIIQK